MRFPHKEEDRHRHKGRSQKVRFTLLALLALLGAALALGGGGAFLYKSLKGGGAEESARRTIRDQASWWPGNPQVPPPTPFIRADERPLKGLPGNPGGKQFPKGEKTV